MPDDQLVDRLKELALRVVELTDRLRAFTNDDPAVQDLRRAAADAIDRGDYDAADAALIESDRIDAAAIAEQREALDRRQISRSRTLSERGDLALTRLDYRAAAGHFEAAAALVPERDANRDTRLGYLDRAADALFRQGQEFGDNAALTEAEGIWRKNLRAREAAALPVADTLLLIANCLFRLGERLGPDFLKMAIGMYDQASKHYDHKGFSRGAALVFEFGKGNAWFALAQWESDAEPLQASLDAHNKALALARNRDTLIWPEIQNSRGAALVQLGERELDTAQLEEALRAFCAAHEEFRRRRASLKCARTLQNLGAALASLGQLEGNLGQIEASRGQLKGAVVACRLALKEFRRDRLPLDWAKTQNGLGGALAALGEMEAGIRRLRQAEMAFRAALGELTCERVPLQWATIQHNLGGALLSQAERTRNVGTARAGRDAIAVAHNVQERAGLTARAAFEQKQLTRADAMIAELSRSVAHEH